MKAITLTQPWATLVAIGAKQIETRSWRANYRGPLAIHAAHTMPAYAKEAASGCDAITNALRAAGYTTRTEMRGYRTWNDEKWLPSGVVVATCELVDCVLIPQQGTMAYSGHFDYEAGQYNFITLEYKLPPDEPELSFGDYTPGRYAWILKNVKALPETLPARGALGLWELQS